MHPRDDGPRNFFYIVWGTLGMLLIANAVVIDIVGFQALRAVQ